MTPEEILQTDCRHIWHPYSKMESDIPVYPVSSASGVTIKLATGEELIDGMSSWWCAIHGYNHPSMNRALAEQTRSMAHIMFGGLTHDPAARLAKKLVELTPDPMQCVFFTDSGSVSVEVAMKMGLQYWNARGVPEKQRFIAVENGYHGDTLGAMSVCDPVNGMHSLFQEILPKHYFAGAPARKFTELAGPEDTDEIRHLLDKHHHEIAGLIIEPIVQAAGGMRFYSPGILTQIRQLCDEYKVLLILDEIATGFGRTGKFFACEHAGIAPDIMCLGKALTGGYMSLAATLCTRHIATTIDSGDPGVFMHGPTFMANPLACALGVASINLLEASDWQKRVRQIESGLKSGLQPCSRLTHVTDVRVLGAIGVVELTHPVDMATITREFVSDGVWVRPFGKLVYLMPPFVIEDSDLDRLTASVCRIVKETC